MLPPAIAISPPQDVQRDIPGYGALVPSKRVTSNAASCDWAARFAHFVESRITPPVLIEASQPSDALPHGSRDTQCSKRTLSWILSLMRIDL